MSSKSVTRNKLKKCQAEFNGSYQDNQFALTKRLQEERDDLLLQLLGPTEDKSQSEKLYLIYFNLMLKSVREGNKTEEKYYKVKAAEVRNALRTNEID